MNDYAWISCALCFLSLIIFYLTYYRIGKAWIEGLRLAAALGMAMRACFKSKQ
jgi:hypothetical protein